MDNIIGLKLAKPNETISSHTENLKKCCHQLYNLGYIKDENFYKDLLAACEYHDYGKANSKFQMRVKYKKQFNYETEVPHNVLSLFFVEENECIDYISVCFAVLYHHHHGTPPIDIFYKEKDLIRSFLNELKGSPDLYYDYKSCVKKINELFSLREDDIRKKYAVLLKGFLHKCDYSASAGIQCEYKNDFLCAAVENWKNQNLVTLNPLQEFCRSHRNDDIIVTAPTGMGKTEAGLLWCGDNKCFFVLPLRTAINAMYDRLKKLSGDEYKNRVALIHSDMKSYYYNDNAANESGEFDFDYCVKSRQMSLPVTICTPDQIFDFVLKFPGYEYKLATASYSKFIIDEIQMYSPDLLAAIIYAVKRIHQMGGRFAILTATLPPFVRAELEKALGDKLPATADFSSDGTLRHNVKVIEKQMEADDIISVINSVMSDSVKKFLVVCNSIDIANKLYDSLKESFKDKMPVNLFHADFIKSDRAKKEKSIFNASKDRTRAEIWISTSVIEASLDIDFDVLFTELSDLFSLFQRFGRVNRKGKKNFDNTNCYVFTEIQGNAKRFLLTKIYSLSKQAIMTIDGIISEKEKSSLIEEYLSVENIENSEYAKEYHEKYRYIEELIDYENSTAEKLRNIDKVDVIPNSVYENNLNKIKNAVSTLNDRKSSKEDKLKANEFLLGLTVSVSCFEAKKANKKINAGFIPVIDNCTYDEDRGFAIIKAKNKPTQDFDLFL